jgi:hypothetical protein
LRKSVVGMEEIRPQKVECQIILHQPQSFAKRQGGLEEGKSRARGVSITAERRGGTG